MGYWFKQCKKEKMMTEEIRDIEFVALPKGLWAFVEREGVEAFEIEKRDIPVKIRFVKPADTE